MQTVTLALRNISRQRKRSALLGGAIGFGVMIIVLAGSLSAGILSNARRNVADIFGGHVYIRGSEVSESGKVIARTADDAALEKALSSLSTSVLSIRKRSSARCEIVFASKSETATVEGVDWASEAELVKRIGIDGTPGFVPSSSPANSIVLPSSIAGKLGVSPGETVFARLTTVTGQVSAGDFLVAAVYREQETVGIASSFASLSYLDSLIGLGPGEYQSLNVMLRDIGSIDSFASDLTAALEREGSNVERTAPGTGSGGSSGHMSMMRGLFGGAQETVSKEKSWKGTRFAITTLNELMEPLQSIMRILDWIRIGLFAILLVIILVGLLNSFRMILIERTREIGTFRALGMQKGAVRNLFLLEALFLALGGASGGLACAVLVSLSSRFVCFDGNAALRLFTSGGHFSFPVVPSDIALTLAILVGSTLFAAWLPARKASRLEPADALRSQF